MQAGVQVAIPPPSGPPAPCPCLAQVLDVLEEAGFSQDRFYIHCDGALFGMMMPFIKKAPMVTFKKPIGSVRWGSRPGAAGAGGEGRLSE